VKFVNTRPFADPEVAALKIVDLANAVEPYFDNRILIEKINGPFLYELRGTPAEYKAGLVRALNRHVERVFESSGKRASLGKAEAGARSVMATVAGPQRTKLLHCDSTIED
jgi:hypothetical protein